MNISKSKLLQTIALIDSQTFPSLGDERKRYTVQLSEPEINAIHAAFGFMLSGCACEGLENYWKHYGPTIQRLSERLGAFDDNNAPFQETTQ